MVGWTPLQLHNPSFLSTKPQNCEGLRREQRGRKWGGLAYDVSSSQAAQDFGTSPPCDGEDLVSIAATAWFPPLFLSGTCIPQIHGSDISPQGFHFPAARFCRAPAGLPFSAFFWHWFGEQGGATGMPCKHHCRLPLPLNTTPQKMQCSLSPTDSSSLRSPFSLPVSSDQLTHACLSITEQSCVQVPGARTKLECCLQRKCQYRNTRLFTKPLFIVWQRCMYL